jgi:hypothetical protein
MGVPKNVGIVHAAANAPAACIEKKYLAIDRQRPLSNLAIEWWRSIPSQVYPLVSKTCGAALDVGSLYVLLFNSVSYFLYKLLASHREFHHLIKADRTFSVCRVDKEKGNHSNCKSAAMNHLAVPPYPQASPLWTSGCRGRQPHWGEVQRHLPG